jgi:hypothetical protein
MSSFDADSNLPLIQPQKKTTQVNLWMAAFVALFLLVTAAVIVRLATTHARDEVHPQPTDAVRP